MHQVKSVRSEQGRQAGRRMKWFTLVYEWVIACRCVNLMLGVNIKITMYFTNLKSIESCILKSVLKRFIHYILKHILPRYYWRIFKELERQDRMFIVHNSLYASCDEVKHFVGLLPAKVVGEHTTKTCFLRNKNNRHVLMSLCSVES